MKIVVKTYFRDTTQGGKVVFRPLSHSTVLFCDSILWQGNDEDCNITETRLDENGLVVYRRYEADSDKKPLCGWRRVCQERFYEYEGAELRRIVIVNHEALYTIYWKTHIAITYNE